MVLFIDTETTGKPKNNKASLNDFDNWPRIVQVSWSLYKNNGLLLENKSFIIKPVDFIIPEESTQIHNISNIRATREGSLISHALSELEKDIDMCEIVVAHNIDFDQKVIDSESIRLGRYPIVENKSLLCTMVGATEYCAISNANGYKWPTLQELHLKLFGENFEDAHNAQTDVQVCAKCFWELIDRGILSHERIYTGPFATLFSTYSRKGWEDAHILFLLMQPLLNNEKSNFNWQKAREQAINKSPELFAEIEKISKENAQVITQEYGTVIVDLAFLGKDGIITEEIETLKNNIDEDLEDFWSFSTSSDKHRKIVSEYLNLYLSNFASLIIEYVKIEKYKKETSDLFNKTSKSEERKTNDSKSSNCYVATFAYGGIYQTEVSLFRIYRDTILRKNYVGQSFIWLYYIVSPLIVIVMEKIPNSRYISKRFLDYLLTVNIIPKLRKHYGNI